MVTSERLTVDRLIDQAKVDPSPDKLLDLMNEELRSDSPRRTALRFLESALVRLTNGGEVHFRTVEGTVIEQAWLLWGSVGRCREHGEILWEGRMSGHEGPLLCNEGPDGGHYVELADAKQER